MVSRGGAIGQVCRYAGLYAPSIVRLSPALSVKGVVQQTISKSGIIVGTAGVGGLGTFSKGSSYSMEGLDWYKGTLFETE